MSDIEPAPERLREDGRARLFLLFWRLAWWFLLPLWAVVAFFHAATRGETRRVRLWRLRRQLGRGLPARDDPFLRDARPLVWVHAVSVGELTAAMPLINALAARKKYRFLVTTTTVSSLHLARRNFGADAVEGPGADARHAILPFDHPVLARRFVRRWRAGLVIFVEGDLWPSLCSCLSAEGIPVAVVSARHSPRSRRRWLRYRSVARAIYGRVNLVAARYREEMEYFERLGVGRVVLGGEIKDAAPAPVVNEKERAALAPFFAERPVWSAISVHEGELDAVILAHQEMARDEERLLTVICPRHPIDATMRFFVQRLERAGIVYTRRSLGEMPVTEGGVYLADTFGEVGLWSSLAGAVFVGGSLIDNGGHNLREPAWCGRRCSGGDRFTIRLWRRRLWGVWALWYAWMTAPDLRWRCVEICAEAARRARRRVVMWRAWALRHLSESWPPSPPYSTIYKKTTNSPWH